MNNVILWGQHKAHGPLWLKLQENPSCKELKYRAEEGWKLAVCPIGDRPEQPTTAQIGLTAEDAKLASRLYALARKLSALCPSNEGLGGHAPLSAFLELGMEAREALKGGAQ